MLNWNGNCIRKSWRFCLEGGKWRVWGCRTLKICLGDLKETNCWREILGPQKNDISTGLYFYKVLIYSVINRLYSNLVKSSFNQLRLNFDWWIWSGSRQLQKSAAYICISYSGYLLMGLMVSGWSANDLLSTLKKPGYCGAVAAKPFIGFGLSSLLPGADLGMWGPETHQPKKDCYLFALGIVGVHRVKEKKHDIVLMVGSYRRKITIVRKSEKVRISEE